MPYTRENYNFYIITVHHCGLALINAILVCFTNYSRSDVFAAKDGKKLLLLLLLLLLSLLSFCYILFETNLKLYHSPSPKQLHVYNTGPF